MNITIPFTATEEARLADAAAQRGLTPGALLKELTLASLPPASASAEEAINDKLRQWQAQDGKALRPDLSTRMLFAQWAEEDALMTDAERETEDQLWQELEQEFVGNGVVPRLSA